MYDLVSVVGTLGVVASQTMNLSTIPSILQIHRAKSTLMYPSFPVSVAITNAIHNILYGHASGNHFIVVSSSLTLLLNLVFLLVHHRYSKNRSRVLSEITYIPVLTALFSLGVVATSGSSLSDSRPWLGFMSSTFSSLAYCGQLSTLASIIKSKNAESISPWMTAGVAFRASSWSLYAVLIRDPYYLFSASIGLISAVTQVVLLIAYRPTKMKSGYPIFSAMSTVHNSASPILTNRGIWTTYD